MNRPDDRLIRIGVVAGAHGVRGQIKVRTYTDDPKALASYGVLLDEHGQDLFEPVCVGSWRHGIIVGAPGFDDRDAAQALTGTALFVPRSRLPEPEDDEFYHEDLIGLEALTRDGESLGRIIAIHDFGAGDVLEIRTGDNEWMVPFLEETVPEIDLEGGRIVVDMPAPDSALGDAA